MPNRGYFKRGFVCLNRHSGGQLGGVFTGTFDDSPALASEMKDRRLASQIETALSNTL